jgi:hypothetical protein
MGGMGYIGVAALILLLLPVVVLPWEGRRVPDACYAALAAGGLAMAGLQHGLGGVVWAAAAGAAILLAVTAIVAGIKTYVNVQLATAGHIKLLSAGSVWLGLAGAAIMLCMALVVLFTVAIFQSIGSRTQRPDFSAIAALAILCVNIQQIVPDREPAAASAANSIR